MRFLQFEIFIQLFFFPFLFPSVCCCTVVPYVVSVWIICMWYRGFEGSPCVSVISRCVQLILLLEGDIMCCLARGQADMRAPTGSREKKKCLLSRNMSKEQWKNFFLAPGRPSFFACVDYPFWQRLPERLFLYICIHFLCLFNFYFLFYCFFFISYLIPTEV